MNFAAITQRQLLDDYAPASVLINRKCEVLYIQGPTGNYLEAPTGEPTRDLIAMARYGLQARLRTACHKAIRENKIVRDSTPHVKHDNSWQSCTITVKPISEPKQAEGLLLVTFHENEVMPSTEATTVTQDESQDDSSLVHYLKYELKTTREDLQNTIENMESANEQLQVSNEEIMSMNEELQCANEELETSKEELKLLNEELKTVNSELQEKIEERDKARSDMSNLLNSANIAALFIDTQLCIRQFTDTTGKLLGLITSDVGRPLNNFATELISKSLITEAHDVLNDLTPIETQLTISNGRHYLRRILPYRTENNQIDGLVVIFTDITQRIESDAEIQRMATILQDSNDAVTVMDLNGNITAWNKGAQRMYGYSEAEALKLNIIDLLPAEKIPLMSETLKLVSRGELDESRDTVRLAKDGRAIDVWIVFTILTNERGEPVALATTERDLAERKQLDVLRMETERLLRMVEHLPVGAVHRVDGHLALNRACEEITGYRRDELATLDQWFEKLHGKQAAEHRGIYENARESNFPRRTGPIMITRKDGEKRYIEHAGYKHEDQEVWILHDVTQRLAAESALRDRQEYLRAVMNNAAEAIVVTHLDGTITDFNRAAEAVFGYSSSEVIGQNIKLMMPAHYYEKHDLYLAKHQKTDHPPLSKPRELYGKCKNGDIIPLERRITQIKHLDVFVGIIRDLSDQKTLERQIAEVSTQEQERIGQEIHDSLGQQLTGISMMAASLKRNLTLQHIPEAEQMNELTLQLQRAIKDARTLSRGLSPVPVTPEGLQDALTLLAHDVTANTGIDCKFEAQNAIEIKDRTTAMQIYRIAQEAVNNAVKHAHADTINITLKNKANGAELKVSDNGQGFDVEKASKQDLGLRIMRYRAGILGCALDVKSSAGKGTEIYCKRVD
jgi:PAS domain S-box-containing protein